MSGLRLEKARQARKPSPRGASPVPSAVFITSSAAIAFGRGHRQREADQSAPVLHDQRDVPEIERLDQAEQRLAVEIEGIGRFVGRLVGAAEARKVGRHHAIAGAGEDRDHAAIEVAPGRLAMQAEPGPVGLARSFVDVMQAKPVRTLEVARRVGPVGQGGEILVRCAQGVGQMVYPSGDDRPLKTRPAEGRRCAPSGWPPLCGKTSSGARLRRAAKGERSKAG